MIISSLGAPLTEKLYTEVDEQTLSFLNDIDDLWDKISPLTLRYLALYHGYINEDDIINEDLMVLIATTAIKVSIEQAWLMGINRFKHYLVTEGFEQRIEWSIEDLYDYYSQVYKA